MARTNSAEFIAEYLLRKAIEKAIKPGTVLGLERYTTQFGFICVTVSFKPESKAGIVTEWTLDSKTSSYKDCAAIIQKNIDFLTNND